MKSNLFEDYQNKKKQIISLASQAAEFGWITKERQKEIVKKIESDVLTIGVIGQMKCGKSTFLNSFVFEDDVLPAATTPMTASLSVITYGETKKIVAEFYTKDEWEEQKITARKDIESYEGNELEQSKIQAAKELVEKSAKLGGNLVNFLGKTQEDSFENLIEYVGADGKYISITKAVKIFYPKEFLKGVEIVDTPGMNDPIVSREERTKDFLQKADVVLLMLYAGRPFDATDRAILFENVSKCGTGKVLIGINKYDIPFEKGEDENDIKNYVEEEIRKACNESNDDTLNQILKSTTPIPLSANMALLSEIPMSKISSNEAYRFAWDRCCNIFEISSQPQFREKSHIDDLCKKVVDVIENEKGEILFAKPKNEILAVGNKKKAEIVTEITKAQNNIKILKSPDDELDDKLEGISKAERKMNKQLDKLEDRFAEKINEVVTTGIHEYEDELEVVINGLKRIVKNKSITKKVWFNDNNLDDSIVIELKDKVDVFCKDIQRKQGECWKSVKKEMRNELDSYFENLYERAGKYLSDFDLKKFLDNLKTSVCGELGTTELDVPSPKSVASRLHDKAFKKEKINVLNEYIISIRNESNFEILRDVILEKQKEILEKIKKESIEEIIEPLKKQIEDCKTKKLNKDKEIKKNEEKIKELENKKSIISEQIKEIQNI